jgi:hypothetical protein
MLTYADIYICIYLCISIYIYIYIYIHMHTVYKPRTLGGPQPFLLCLLAESDSGTLSKKKTGGSQPFILCFLAEDESGTLSKKNNVIVPNKESRGCVGVFLERCVFFPPFFLFFIHTYMYMYVHI